MHTHSFSCYSYLLVLLSKGQVGCVPESCHLPCPVVSQGMPLWLHSAAIHLVTLPAQGKLTLDPQALSVAVHNGRSADIWKRERNMRCIGIYSSPSASQVCEHTHMYIYTHTHIYIHMHTHHTHTHAIHSLSCGSRSPHTHVCTHIHTHMQCTH